MKFLYLYKIIARILCSIGCIYQTYKLSSNYLSYGTTTNVRYETQTDAYLPAITVCSQTKFIQFKEEELAKYGKLYISERLNISQQFEALEKTPVKLLDCWVNSDSGNESCWAISQFNYYIDYFRFCFTIFPQLEEEPDENYKLGEDDKTLAYIILKKEIRDHLNPDDIVHVYLHSRDQILYKDDENQDGVIMMNVKEFDFALVSYYMVTIKYMFEPFGGCFKGETKSQCLQKCVIQNTMEKLESYPRGYLTMRRDIEYKFKYKFEEGEESCKQACNLKNECFKQFFINNQVVTKPSDNVNQSSKIYFQKPSFPATIYEIKLRMNLEEFLCMLSSIFSVWFGFSVVMFTDFCQIFFTKFRLYLVNNFSITQHRNKVVITAAVTQRHRSSTARIIKY